MSLIFMRPLECLPLQSFTVISCPLNSLPNNACLKVPVLSQWQNGKSQGRHGKYRDLAGPGGGCRSLLGGRWGAQARDGAVAGAARLHEGVAGNRAVAETCLAFRHCPSGRGESASKP